MGPDGLIVSEILADYIQQLNATAGDLKRLGIQIPAGVNLTTEVQCWGGGVLVFDQFGMARLHQSKPLIGLGADREIALERQSRRLKYLASRGVVDTYKRLGFSLGERQGQRFSALHAADSRAGESW